MDPRRSGRARGLHPQGFNDIGKQLMRGLATTAERDHHQAVLSRQLSVIPEMLVTLETLTIAGRHHLIGKLVTFLVTFIEELVRCADPRVVGTDEATLSGVMKRLKQESERLVPDVASVSRDARTLMALITAVE